MVTLGSLSLFRGLAEGITGAVDNYTGLPASFLSLGQGYLAGVPRQAPLLLLVMLGFSPEKNTDVLAHVAGFAAGALLGLGACFLPPAWIRNVWVGHLGQCAVAGIVAFCWWLAFRYGHALAL